MQQLIWLTIHHNSQVIIYKMTDLILTLNTIWVKTLVNLVCKVRSDEYIELIG